MRFSTLFLLTAAGAANAGIVTIDAASFAPGANITSATPGISLYEIANYGMGTGYAMNPVYAVGPEIGAVANYIGHNNANPRVLRYDFGNNPSAVNCYVGGTCSDAYGHVFNGLLMNFQYPTNLLQLRVYRSEYDIDYSYLRIYNRQRQLLASCYVTGANNTAAPRYVPSTPPFVVPCGRVVRQYDCNSSGTSCKSEIFVSISRFYPDIAFAIWGGEGYDTTRGAIDRISFRRFSDCEP